MENQQLFLNSRGWSSQGKLLPPRLKTKSTSWSRISQAETTTVTRVLGGKSKLYLMNFCNLCRQCRVKHSRDPWSWPEVGSHHLSQNCEICLQKFYQIPTVNIREKSLHTFWSMKRNSFEICQNTLFSTRSALSRS